MSEQSFPGWGNMSPAVRDILADMAFQNDGTLTPEITEAITNNAIQDVIEAPQAGQGE